MSRREDTHIARLTTLVWGALHPPPGGARILVALAFGVVVHSIFAAAVFAMITAMFFGMSQSLGTISWPLAALANATLILQFPIVHSLLLTRRGSRWMANLLPKAYGETLATTNYAIIASVQLLLLFIFWTPSGIIWWEAEGAVLFVIICVYATAWLMLIKASFDAGAEVQSGALGWMSLLQNIKPRFPGMPKTGLFHVIRQPIYVAFALTLWTVPVWTPDQLVLALTLTTYCLAAPKLKERRFEKRYGNRFRAYQRMVPYAVLSFGKKGTHGRTKAQ